jgi:hypothetical protein
MSSNQKNIYNKKSISTLAQALPELHDIKAALADFKGHAIVWKFNDLVYLDDFELAKIDFEDVLQLRVFNDMTEVYVWRSNGVLRGRLRKDSLGEDSFITESTSYLDNLIAERNRSFKGFTKICTINYIDFADNQRAYYNDMRVVRLAH